MKRTFIRLFVFFILPVALLVAAAGYFCFLKPNVNVTEANDLLLVPTGTTYPELLELIKTGSILSNEKTFDFTADRMHFDQSSVKPGRYRLNSEMTNIDLIRHLRSGNQEAISITLNSHRTLADLAEYLDERLEFTAEEFIDHMTSEEVLKRYSLTEYSAMTLFIPNTYEIFWNTSAKKFISRMKTESDRFWDQDQRLKRAESFQMDRRKAYTLASIIEKETAKNDEKPIIAGVYINRIFNGMPLQADPTVIFGVGDFSIRRVLNKHLEHDSPYNTYMYPGLPPGPICMPTMSSLKAVLYPQQHDYLYFCAKPDRSGYHAFAKNLAQHNRNARAYHNSL